jgi:AraC-like DNA-binding protein/ubiquinone/menaquinone biosynthesis C-methylase UbiE
MNWQTAMNEAMTYIEEHLTEKINIYVLSQFLNCSEWEFRRLFSVLTQIPLSEYIRRRKLSVAVKDIQGGDKIIDVANRYGYKSHAAFSRAFKTIHKISPSMVTKGNISLNDYPPLDFKLLVIENISLEEQLNKRLSIIGASQLGHTISQALNRNQIHKTNKSFWHQHGSEFLGEMSLPYYGAFVSEKTCQFFTHVMDKKVLEIGCGSGRSLAYLGKRKAGELWGLDISENQIEKAKQLLSSHKLCGRLICSPMEEDCGLPQNYFDYVYSIYGIGWTTNLESTFKKIATYLKKNGTFIFSWSHPIHKCVSLENDMLIFKKNYFDESWYKTSVGDNNLSLTDRKLSTYINALAKAGFLIEEMIEESEEDLLREASNNFSKKAGLLPVTLVIKAKKR